MSSGSALATVGSSDSGAIKSLLQRAVLFSGSSDPELEDELSVITKDTKINVGRQEYR